MADRPANDAPFRLLTDVSFGDRVVVHSFANLYGCSVGDDTRIGPFVALYVLILAIACPLLASRSNDLARLLPIRLFPSGREPERRHRPDPRALDP